MSQFTSYENLPYVEGKKKKNNESGNDSFLRTEAKVALSKPLLLNLS